MHLITIAFEQLIGIHPKLSEPVKATSQLMYTAQIKDFNPTSFEKLLMLYPIHVIRHRNEKSGYYVVAGLRQYEMLCVFHALNLKGRHPQATLTSIPVIEYQKLSTESINELARCDIAGSALLFSLGTKVATQLTLIKDCLGPSIVEQFPKYESERRMVDREARKISNQ